MSIFVQQPRRRKGLSGLGAFNELLPAIRERGVAAILDADWACDYELIYARVYDELAAMPQYARDTAGLRADAATHAYSIWMQRCPQASYVDNSTTIYQDADGVWRDRRGHRHHGPHGGGGGGTGPMQAAPHYHAAPQPVAHMRASTTLHARSPMQHTAPMRTPPMHHSGGGARMAPVRVQPHSSNRGMRVRGLGDGTTAPTLDASVSRNLQRQIQAGRTSAGATVAAARATVSSPSAIADRAATEIYPFADFTPGTLDPCLDTTTGQPMPCDQMPDAQRAMCAACGGTSSPSAVRPLSSIEGALPTAVAGLLGIGVGLTLMSIFVK